MKKLLSPEGDSPRREFSAEMERETVYGLYNDGWTGVIVPEAFSHPAKFSRKLIYWIIKAGLERNWWRPGDMILDPFGGVGLGGLAAAAHGLRWLGVEIEERFCRLAEQNFDLCREGWRRMGLPEPRIIQGDSRRLLEIMREYAGAALGGITSPPYGEIREGDKQPQRGQQGGPPHADYGQTPGQIANMGAITSPPFGQADTGGGILKEGYQGRPDLPPDFLDKRHYAAHTAGQTEGNIAALGGIASPPYAELRQDGGSSRPGYGAPAPYSGEDRIQWRTQRDQRNIGNLPEGNVSAITSPPYEASSSSGQSGIDWKKAGRPERDAPSGSRHGVQGTSMHEMRYGTGFGNLGNQQGETYWQAIDSILRQLWQIFPPNGHLAWVVKPFVRNKRIVDLPQMTLYLMLHQGWEPVAWIDAMLVAEAAQADIFGGSKRTEQKSFFRRLIEAKGGPKIDAETVLVVRKPFSLRRA